MTMITLNVDETLLDAARRYAAERNITLDALVRRHFEQIIEAPDRRREAIDRLRRLSEESIGRIGSRTWTRDDLHER